MASQLSLNFGEEYKKPPAIKKAVDIRIRYKIPKYIKFYSIYQYNREKFTKLLKIWLETEEGQNRTLESLKEKQIEILNLCYERAIDGSYLRDSDERHIFRYRTLEKLHNSVYNELGVNPFIEERYIQDGLAVYPDEEQAEILNTWKLSIKNRIKLHIKLLRLLREGFSVKEAICRLRT